MKVVKGCLTVILVFCVAVILISEFTRERKPAPPPYNGPKTNYERLDRRAIGLLANKEYAVLKSGDTTITWEKIRNKKHKELYTERKRIGNSAYTTFKIFYGNKQIMFHSEQFQDAMYMGWTREYDKSGKLIRTYNEDEKFDFTIDDLIKMVKDKYGRDLRVQLEGREFAKRSTVSSSNVSYYTLNIYIAMESFYC